MMHYHLIGIGGTGLSAIARILFERGNKVSGSDLQLSPLAQELIKLGVHVDIGHDARNIKGADLIIRSSAIPDSNPEIIAALEAKIPLLKRREFLTELTADSKVIAVAGTHGKTTTTSMIAWCLSEMGMDPSYVIGGTVKNLTNNAHSGKGEYFVIEADEYDRMFLGLNPDVLAITNIEYDHPDCFPTEEEYFEAFFKLSGKVKAEGTLIVCIDHPGNASLLEKIKRKQKVITYGTLSDSNYKIENVVHKPGSGIAFDLLFLELKTKMPTTYRIKLSIPGIHNALNAVAVISVLNTIELPLQKAINALENFKGAGRRFDLIGAPNDITIIDDYAHHPTEIQATISAARNQYPINTIWTVWQPHTFSRTKELFSDFITSFEKSDHVIVTEIFASREKKDTFSSERVVESMNHPDVKFIAQLENVTTYLKNNLKSGDVLLVLSAGDANRISQDVLNYFKNHEESK
jgi:UDP-N-acetylmuramate--alanine ligase